MTTQNYCMVNKDSNICENITVWDGNPDTWTPPSNYLMLIQATTLSKVWQINTESGIYELKEVLGLGDIGFTWDGTYLITNQPQPSPLLPDPITDLPTV